MIQFGDSNVMVAGGTEFSDALFITGFCSLILPEWLVMGVDGLVLMQLSELLRASLSPVEYIASLFNSEDELKMIEEVVSTFSFEITLCCYACIPRCCNTVQGVNMLVYQSNSHEEVGPSGCMSDYFHACFVDVYKMVHM
ncbi:uncharacterized protein LOC113289352 isoform X2 [Papaver somniferum]|uniref:uncharacterized protein LOC113289352 isoform X2 n=1 Tax=Papaver somniferum TaxID=3469 RepID=UPI000E6F5D83|nr:uncharacterized protein LOC113289352 isoform X2 [Papaver somniferum]